MSSYQYNPRNNPFAILLRELIFKGEGKSEFRIKEEGHRWKIYKFAEKLSGNNLRSFENNKRNLERWLYDGKLPNDIEKICKAFCDSGDLKVRDLLYTAWNSARIEKNNQKIIYSSSYKANRFILVDENNYDKFWRSKSEFMSDILKFDEDSLDIGKDDLNKNEAPSPVAIQVWFDLENTWRVLLDRKSSKIGGYWHFVPLEPDAYKRAKSGQFLDSEISRDRQARTVCDFDFPSTYDIYVAYFGIGRKVGKIYIKDLLISFFEVVFFLAREKNIFIGKICANGLSPSGEGFCKRTGMKQMCNSKLDAGMIYEEEMTKIMKNIRAKGDMKILLDRIIELYRA